MSKFKGFLLHLSISLVTISPSYATDNPDQSSNRSRFHYTYLGLGNFDYVPMDDLFDEDKTAKPLHTPHAFVPNSQGKKQGREAFKLLFTGNEDPSTVLITTRTSQKHYTLRESVRYMLSGEKAPEYAAS